MAAEPLRLPDPHLLAVAAVRLIGLVLTPVGVGFVILPAVWVWVAVRCILGLSWLLKGQPYPTPRNWMI
jgi:uncharacterized membrane protein